MMTDYGLPLIIALLVGVTVFLGVFRACGFPRRVPPLVYCLRRVTKAIQRMTETLGRRQ